MPAGSVGGVVIASVAVETWSVRDWLVACGVGTQESVTVAETVKVPLVVGVPEINPPVVIERPEGSPLAPQEMGATPPELVSWRE